MTGRTLAPLVSMLVSLACADPAPAPEVGEIPPPVRSEPADTKPPREPADTKARREPADTRSTPSTAADAGAPRFPEGAGLRAKRASDRSAQRARDLAAILASYGADDPGVVEVISETEEGLSDALAEVEGLTETNPPSSSAPGGATVHVIEPRRSDLADERPTDEGGAAE